MFFYRCPETGRGVRSGFDLPEDTPPSAIPEILHTSRTLCPACHDTHELGDLDFFLPDDD
jgi:hypothetical protein